DFANRVNLSVSANSGTEAGATQITVTATADSAVTSDQTVSLAVSGTGITTGDYTLSGATITILSGHTTGSVTFTIKDDNTVEAAPQTAVLTLSNPSTGIALGSTTTQNIDITDNDSSVVSISGASVSEGNSGTKNLGFTISLTNPVDKDITV